MNFAFLWDIPGYFPLFICYRLVAIFFYFCLLRTLMRLGDPHLYVQRAAPEIDEVRAFCQHITERQFRSVPIIIRGATTYESINRAVTLLNQLVADKYQLLALDLREAQALQLSELALASRKRWELQRHQKDLLDVCDTDYFSDLDLQMYAELDTEQWREGMHQIYYYIVRNFPLTPSLAHRASSPFSRESDSAHQNHAANDSVLQRAPLGTQFTQFTCFTGTKVHILTLRVHRLTCKSGPLVAPIRSVISSSRKRLNRPPRKKVAGEAGVWA